VVFALPVIIALSLVYFPSFWVSLCMLVDFYTSWELFTSDIYGQYHKFLISGLKERTELPITEITAEEATTENILRVSKGFTWPVVIRGLLGNTTAVKEWADPEWWIKNYPNEEVLCSQKGSYLSEQVDNCNIKIFFEQLKTDNPYYMVGATSIFDNNPELHHMVNNEAIDKIEPGHRISTQMFFGLPDHGSDIHCAAGVNIFRQVAGRKKWWFIPPHQSAYIKPSINLNGFSAFTHTLVGKEGKEPSPWLTKIERYTTIMNPGDVLINPPWFWHGILNLGSRENNDLVIGCPSRYGKGNILKAGFTTNFMFTVVGLTSLVKKYGLGVLSPTYKMNLQKDISGNRKVRTEDQLAGSAMDEQHPFDVEASNAD